MLSTTHLNSQSVYCRARRKSTRSWGLSASDSNFSESSSRGCSATIRRTFVELTCLGSPSAGTKYSIRCRMPGIVNLSRQTLSFPTALMYLEIHSFFKFSKCAEPRFQISVVGKVTLSPNLLRQYCRKYCKKASSCLLFLFLVSCEREKRYKLALLNQFFHYCLRRLEERVNHYTL